MFKGGKEDLRVMCAVLEKENEFLKERVAELKQEVIEHKEAVATLQEALLVKEAPEVYHEKKAREYEEHLSPEEQKHRAEQSERSRITRQYLENMESPLFRDADDMIEMLSRAVGTPQSPPLSNDGEG
jgi:cell division septum initiation protein DivIVA